jgi:hypothetical protein
MVPWNKGKKLHYTVWNKGKKRPEITGENHPMFGKHHTPEAIEKMRQKSLGHRLSDESRKRLSLIRKQEWATGRRKGGWKLTDKTKNKMKNRIPWNVGIPIVSGEQCWNWKGGRSRWYREGYYTKKYLNWRRDVFVRDEFTCKDCGKKHIYITAHHIKSWVNYPELRFDVDNGRTLCEDCHKKTDNYKARGRKNCGRF